MRIFLLLPIVLLSSCAELANSELLNSIGYSIKTDWGTYRDDSINGQADGELDLAVDTVIDLRSGK